MADVDGALAALRRVLGEGAPPAWPSRDFGYAIQPVRDWTGSASERAEAASANLDARREEMARAHRHVAALIAEAGDVAGQARAAVAAIIACWDADKAELAAVSETPAGKQAYVQRGAQRIDEAAAVVRTALRHYGELAEVVEKHTAALPEGPGAGRIHPIEYDFGHASPTPEADRERNQIEAFRQFFGRAPASTTDWTTAAALDPHSYEPKNQGVPPSIVVARIEPERGQGVVRTNLFIPSEDVWAPALEVPPDEHGHVFYDNNLGDHRGFDPGAGPEESRVVIYTDFDNGIIVARQNPSVNADTGQVRSGTPNVSAVQQSNGAVLIDYNAADPFSPGGEGIAKDLTFSVNGTLGIVPGDNGPRVGGDVTTFPALEIYSDRGNGTKSLLQSWPSFTDDASGPLIGLLPNKVVGDPSVIGSFNSVVPELLRPSLPLSQEGIHAAPMVPASSIVPPANFTDLTPATSTPPPTVRRYTPRNGTEMLSHP